MSGFVNHAKFEDDFFGGKTYTSTVGEGNWKITDTSSAGTPTYASVSPSATGEVALTFDSTNEIQNVCLDFGDKLCFDIDNIQRAVFIVKTVASLSSATTLAFGLQSARNDDTDATTNNAQFKLAGSNAIVCETDDGTTDLDDKASGVSLPTRNASSISPEESPMSSSTLTAHASHLRPISRWRLRLVRFNHSCKSARPHRPT